MTSTEGACPVAMHRFDGANVRHLLCVQVCDFGYSKHEKYQSAPGSRVGTPAYLAPEVIMTTKGKTYDGKVRYYSESSQPNQPA